MFKGLVLSQLVQYYSISYLQLWITKFTGHKNTMKKTKGLVKLVKKEKKVSLVNSSIHVKSLVQSRSFLLRKM